MLRFQPFALPLLMIQSPTISDTKYGQIVKYKRQSLLSLYVLVQLNTNLYRLVTLKSRRFLAQIRVADVPIPFLN